MNKLIPLLLIITYWSCTTGSETEKYQKTRDNIVNVREKVKEIKMEDVLIDRNARPHSIGNYLLICDYRSYDNLILLFDKQNFNYITGTGYKGQGPNEITNIGYIGINEADLEFYVTDYGKQKIFGYKLDSVLSNPFYKPEVKMTMKEKQFPRKYQYINDTLSIGTIIEPTGNSSFNESAAMWNMHTGETKRMKYVHPDIERKRSTLAVSVENNLYAECFHHHDLMTICTLDGELKCNIYGSKWNSEKTNSVRHYSDVVFCKDKIVASYSCGRDNFGNNFWPTQFLVFDKNGDYLQTWETGYNISDFCYDKENNRIIMSLEDEIQFAYLELDGLYD